MPTASQSPVPLADKLPLLENFDGLAGLRNGLRRVANDREDWAGIPMPLSGHQLVIEPNYPKAAELMEIGKEPAEELDPGIKLRNTFYSAHKRANILVIEDHGKITYGVDPRIHHLNHDLTTLGCSDAWGIEQESNAVNTLAGLVSHRKMKQYLITGMFLESSKRSHVAYLFRRLRPTVAMTKRNPKVRILCCLCMHPIAYYAGSWAGAMCPTDDVIAHLMLMRGDEKMFWRRCNQHPASVPEAGL